MDSRAVIGIDDEREILYDQLCDAVESAFAHHKDGKGYPEAAVTAILRRLRVMSARQVAVLLAQEANRHERWVIHEPPDYSDAT